LANKAIKQFGRWEYVFKNYVDANGKMPKEAYDLNVLGLEPNKSISNTVSSARGGNPQWTQVGPTKNVNPHGYVEYPGMGRVNVARWLGNTTYIVATPNGGIWKTTNNGVNWTPKTDQIARIGITDIRIHPTNNNIMYAMTGDRDGTHCPTIGMIKSTDGGETWSTTGKVISPNLDEAFSTAAIGIHPTQPEKLIMAANSKTYYTNDGGTSFQETTTKIEIAYDIIYTSDFALISTKDGQIYKTTNNGQSFELIFEDKMGVKDELCLRFSPKVVNNHIYILAGIKKKGSVFKVSTANVLAATVNNPINLTDVGESIDDYSPQGAYNVTVAVDPSNDNNIYVAGVDGYFSTDAGETWTKALDAYSSDKSGQLYVHPDHHFAEFVGTNQLLTGHDGGVSIINTSKLPFTQEDITGNLIIGQIYHTGIYSSDTNNENFMMGMQDNDGFSKSPNTLGGEWVAVSAGDGSGAAINQNNPLIRFIGSTHGGLDRTKTAFKQNFKDKENVIEADEKEIAPFICEVTIHNTNPDHVFAGHIEMKYSTDSGLTFEDVPSSMNVGPTAEIEQYGSRIAVVGEKEQVIAEYDNGDFKNVEKLSKPQGVERLFNSISLSTTNNSVIYATIGGFEDGEKIFKSTDNGDTWTNISYDLPNVIAKKVVSQATNLGTSDEILYLATNVGVYVKKGSINKIWQKVGDNLPFTDVNDLDINYTAGKIYASTYGRGIWEYPINQSNVGVTNPIAEALKTVKMSPNPIANGQTLTITLPQEINTAKCSIYNYIGGQMATFEISSTNNNILLPSLSVGTYLVVIEHKGQQIGQPLLILK
jgi:Sortilin, neurotensin receptor 3,/BNR/Asp-box repeat